MHFRVAVEEMMPGILLKEGNGTLTAKGPLIDLLLLIAERLNFTYSLKRSVDNSWGSLGENGWTGMIGMIFRNEVDFAISPFTLNYQRWSALQTSVPVYVDHVDILLPFTEFQISLFTVLTIYKWDVWLSLLLTVFILSFITIVSNRYFSAKMSLFHVVLNYLWQAYRNFLLQGYKERSRHSSPLLRCLSLVLVLLTMVMSFVFSGSLLTTLVVRRVKPIDSLEELAESDTCPILEKSSSTYSHFEHSQSEVMKKLLQRANANPDRNILTLKSMTRSGIKLVDAGTHAIFVDGSIVHSILASKIKRGESCRYRIAKHPVIPMWKVLAFSGAFPRQLFNKINKIIQRSTETGFLSARLEQENEGYQYCLNGIEQKVNSLSLDHFKGVFLIWSVGCSIGLVILLVECFFQKRCIILMQKLNNMLK